MKEIARTRGDLLTQVISDFFLLIEVISFFLCRFFFLASHMSLSTLGAGADTRHQGKR